MNQNGNSINLFGEILTVVLKFIESSFDTTIEYYDPVSQRKLIAENLFQKRGNRWYLRSESLPGNLSVRALGFDAENLYIETGTWIDENLKKVLVTQSMQYKQSEKEIGEIKDSKERLILRSSRPVSPEIGNVKFMHRMLCTVPIGDIGAFHRYKILMMLDELFECGAWDGSMPVENEPSGTRKPEMRMELSMVLIETLEMEQRPMLEQEQIMGVEQIMDMRQNLEMLFVQQRQIMAAIDKGDQDELARILADYRTKYGTKGVDNLTVFVLAARVKKIRPQLDWKNARKLARSIFNKTAVK